MRRLRIERLGRMAYAPMTRWQEERHAMVCAGDADDTLFLLEHNPVVTLGKNTAAGHVLVAPEELERQGVELYRASRGGDVTYHGPGQVVGYPILRLESHEQDIKAYVYRLEEILIRCARDFGVVASRIEGLRGIWVGNDKLAAIGVRIARWTTMHGFAINVCNDPSEFGVIVPCGLHGRGVTSLSRATGRSISTAEAMQVLVRHAAEVLERDGYEIETLREGVA